MFQKYYQLLTKITPLFSNNQFFITDATGDYKNATFIDGTGKQVPYTIAHKIVSDAYEKLLNQNS